MSDMAATPNQRRDTIPDGGQVELGKTGHSDATNENAADVWTSEVAHDDAEASFGFPTSHSYGPRNPANTATKSYCDILTVLAENVGGLERFPESPERLAALVDEMASEL